MFRTIKEDDICESCRCGAEVEEGDEVEFINRNPFHCDVCPSCEDEVNAAAERAGNGSTN